MAKAWNSKFTQELADAICANLEIAMPLTLAAEAEGVHRTQVYAWMNENESFCVQVTRARARGARELIKLAREGQKGSSTSTWLLERRFNEDFRLPKEAANLDAVTIVVQGGLPRRDDKPSSDA